MDIFRGIFVGRFNFNAAIAGRNLVSILTLALNLEETMTKYLVQSMGITSHLIICFCREFFIKSMCSLMALKSLQNTELDIYSNKELYARLSLCLVTM